MSDRWEGILEEDETILWQGRPDGALHFDFSEPMKLVMGVFFVAFSIFWMSMASRAGGFFWTFGLLFFGVGLFNSIGIHFWEAHMRRRTHYTLTSKRAYIATDLLGRKSLRSYLIMGKTPLEFLDNGDTQTINFAENIKLGKNGTHSTTIGFEHIHGGRDVLKLMRSLQKAQA